MKVKNDVKRSIKSSRMKGTREEWKEQKSGF